MPQPPTISLAKRLTRYRRFARVGRIIPKRRNALWPTYSPILSCDRGRCRSLPRYSDSWPPLLETHGGWKLHGSYFNVIGRLHTVVDVWELPDANAVQTTLEKASQDPEFQKWAPAIEECVEDETLQVMTKLPV